MVGVKLELVNHNPKFLRATIPSIIEGFKLANAQNIFKAAAIELAIRDNSKAWNGLKWLCLLNEIDPDETAEALRNLSKSVRCQEPESYIHPDLPDRIAALLLRLTGQEKDDDRAVQIDPDFFRLLTYDKDYLLNPSKDIFPLERRHAEIVLNNTRINLPSRVRRTKDLWLDPSFEPPATFVNEVRTSTTNIDVEKTKSAPFCNRRRFTL